jgi:hypothetical protein
VSNTATATATAWERTVKNLTRKVGQTFKGGRYRLEAVTATHLVATRCATGSVVKITRTMVERIHAAQQAGATFGKQRAGNAGGISYTVAVEFFVREALAEVVVVVACVKGKLDRPAKAKDLYQSDWFYKARKFAELEGDRWSVLSALHCLVDSETVVAPYDVSVSAPVSKGGLNASERREWVSRCAAQLEAETPRVVVTAVRVRFVVLAGRRYRKAFEASSVEWEAPLAGLGIGDQKRWLKQFAEQAAQDVTEVVDALLG